MVKDVYFDCGFCRMIMSHNKILKAFLCNEASKINAELNPTTTMFKFYHIKSQVPDLDLDHSVVLVWHALLFHATSKYPPLYM